MTYKNKYNKHGYNPQQDENKTQQQLQESVTLSAYDKKIIHKTFRNTIEWLEKYIEIVHNKSYPDWQNRKKIHDNNIKRQDANSPEKIEGLFSAVLFGFKTMSESKPQFLRDELKEEFYQWIGATGINIENCPSRLKNHLFEINEVLEGRGEKLERDVANRKREIEPNSPKYGEELNKMFSDVQIHLENSRSEFKSLEGQTYKDIKVGNNFGGNSEQAEQVFKQMAGKYDYQGFNFFPQKGQQIRNPNYNPLIDDPSEEFLSSSSQAGGSNQGGQHSANSSSSGTSLGIHPTNLNEVVQDIKTNPKNWKLDKIPTEIDNFGRTKKQEPAVYCQHARLDEYNQEGKLNFNNNPIYRWESFKVQERFEIKQAKKISGYYLIDEEIKWVVREVKDNPRVWRIKPIQGQTYLIHNSAQVNDSEIGTLIHNKQKFSETEWVEINGAFERVKLIDEIKQNAKLEKGLFVINRETGERSEGEDWFIHNGLKREFDDKTGYLIYVPNLMVGAKDLTEAEQKEVGYNQQASHEVQSQSHPSGGKGGWGSTAIWGSFTVISLIGLAFTR